MGDKSRIEWTDATWNPVTGCTKVSDGCTNCYAERITERFHGKGSFAVVQRDEEKLYKPMTWKRPRLVFVNSMSDLFHDDVPDSFIANVWSVMARTPRHTFQVLTKRHGRMRSLLSKPSFRDNTLALAPEATWPLPNVWLGVSVENQQWADTRIPALIATPAAVRWLSMEPLLGPVDILPFLDRMEYAGQEHVGAAGMASIYRPSINWVVVGGESGHGARPMHPAWARSLRDQCTGLKVPFFFKQWGEHVPAVVGDAPDFAGGRAYAGPFGGRIAAVIRERGPSRTFRSGITRPMRPGDQTSAVTMLDLDTVAIRVGKKAAGRELDGREWDEYPDRVTAGGAR